MDIAVVNRLRRVLAGTGWLEQAHDVMRAAAEATRVPQGLLVVGTPEHEPWHLVGHLDDVARLRGDALTRPVMIHPDPPPDAWADVVDGPARLDAAGFGESVLVVAPGDPPEELIERLADAHGRGAVVVSVDAGAPALDDLTSARLTVVRGERLSADAVLVAGLMGVRLPEPEEHDVLPFGLAEHLLGSAAARPAGERSLPARVLAGLRIR